MTTELTVPAYILAGGQSARFGSDKARAVVDGQPLVLRIANTLRTVTHGVTVIAQSPERYADLGLRTIADRWPGRGPLAGLDASIHDRGNGWLLLVSCDFVHITPDWVGELVRRRGRRQLAVAFQGERWEPLFALYHTRLAIVVQAHLTLDELALWKVLDEASAVSVPLPCDWPRMAHVNSPLELQQALAQHALSKEHTHGEENLS